MYAILELEERDRVKFVNELFHNNSFFSGIIHTEMRSALAQILLDSLEDGVNKFKQRYMGFGGESHLPFLTDKMAADLTKYSLQETICEQLSKDDQLRLYFRNNFETSCKRISEIVDREYKSYAIERIFR